MKTPPPGFFPFALALFILGGCSLSEFRSGIPVTENENTSLYAEELTAAKVAKLRNKGDTVGALSNGMAYLVRSMGGETTGLLYWEMGMTLRSNIAKPEVVAFLSSLEKSARTVFKVSSNTDGSGFTYNDGHLLAILDSRVNYEVEKKVVALVTLPDLTPATNDLAVKSNLHLADNVSRRWPDTPGLLALMQDKNLFPTDDFSKRQKDIYDDALDRVRLAAIDSPFGGTGRQWRAISGPFAKARNRPHAVKSRILANLEPWEEVEVLGYVSGDTNLPEGWDKAALDHVRGTNGAPDVSKAWARVVFGGGRLGFVETKWVGEPTGNGPAAKAFRQAVNRYYAHEYLIAAEKAAALIQAQGDKAWALRGMALLHATHLQIARRATSRKNPYTRYALSRSDFFRYHEVDHLLAPSDLLVRHLLRLEPQSPLAVSMEMR